MTDEWMLVLNADGTVLAVDGGAPTEWIGSRVDERTDMPAEVRRVAAELRRRLSESGTRLTQASATVASTAPPCRIVVLHALPLCRIDTNLRGLLDSIIAIMAQQARAIDVTLTVDVNPDVPLTCHVDPEKIAWAITALVGNALRFVRRGTRLRPGGNVRVRVRYLHDTGRVIVEVTDDGPGIPRDRLPHLLHRSPTRFHASGLALNLVQDVVVAHGGSVEIESRTEPDQSGATVRLIIPCG
jgi:signal transduction histidine kinase